MKPIINLPIVILTNQATASASEILAGALKDLEEATIVGTTTYGKGVIQQLLTLKTGAGIKVTVQEYYTPSRNKIQGIGIEPNEIVELPDGKIMIIDGGSVNNSEKICEYLFDIGVSTIDYMIATHADEDHIGGLVSVLENFEVKNIYRPFQICGTGTSFNNFVVDNNEDLAEVYDELIGKYGKNSKVSRITSQTYSLFISKIYSETAVIDSPSTVLTTVGLKVSIAVNGVPVALRD